MYCDLYYKHRAAGALESFNSRVSTRGRLTSARRVVQIIKSSKSYLICWDLVVAAFAVFQAPEQRSRTDLGRARRVASCTSGGHQALVVRLVGGSGHAVIGAV